VTSGINGLERTALSDNCAEDTESLYHHTMVTEQMTEGLFAEIRINQEGMEAKIEANSKNFEILQ
jgi:hypothetical protein